MTQSRRLLGAFFWLMAAPAFLVMLADKADQPLWLLYAGVGVGAVTVGVITFRALT